MNFLERTCDESFYYIKGYLQEEYILHLFDPTPSGEGRMNVKYELMDECGITIFSHEDRGEDGEQRVFSPSPMHDSVGYDACFDLLGWLSVGEWDVEEGFFEGYTPKQIEFRDTEAEALSIAVNDYENYDENYPNSKEDIKEHIFKISRGAYEEIVPQRVPTGILEDSFNGIKGMLNEDKLTTATREVCTENQFLFEDGKLFGTLSSFEVNGSVSVISKVGYYVGGNPSPIRDEVLVFKYNPSEVGVILDIQRVLKKQIVIAKDAHCKLCG